MTVFVEKNLRLVENEWFRLVLSSVSEALVLQIRNDNTSKTDRPNHQPPFLNLRLHHSREEAPRKTRVVALGALESTQRESIEHGLKRTTGLFRCGVTCWPGVAHRARSRSAHRPAVA